MRGKLIGISIGFLLLYVLLIWTLPIVLPQFKGVEIAGTWGFYLVIAFAVLLAISGFFPYNWGKITREVAYLLLFITILIAEMAVVTPFVHRINVAADNCSNVFFPKKASGHILYNTIDYTSCVLTGYYPKESAQTANVAWTTFYIFYLILPFAFIWVLMYGLMVGMGMETWFGTFSGTANKVISFIIALFAVRVLMGEVLLEFLGYSAWGLAGVFVSIFIVGGLRHSIESWYQVEAIGEETRKAIEKEADLQRVSMKNLREFVNKSKTLIELNELITPGQTPYHDIFTKLPSEMQSKVKSIVQDFTLTFNQKKARILAVLGGRR